MYEMLVRVHDVSWEILGTMSKMILRSAMRTKWMAQAPVETCQHGVLVMRKGRAELQTFGIDPF